MYFRYLVIFYPWTNYWMFVSSLVEISPVVLKKMKMSKVYSDKIYAKDTLQMNSVKKAHLSILVHSFTIE